MSLVEKNIKLNYDEIDSFQFPLDIPFSLEINYNNLKFCFIIKFSSFNKNLICFGPGAHLRNQKSSNGTLITPPYFDRWSWYQYFDESFIAYADPIFFQDEKITLGWFVGDKNYWYIEILSEIILKLSKKQDILSKNILFFGSSGGGYSSVCLGTLIKDSKVLINNSQFLIMNYYVWHVDCVLNFLKNQFPNLSKSDIAEKFKYRLNVVELFKKENYMPSITYYVNTESVTDMYNQCLPFLNEVPNLPCFNGNLDVKFYKEEKEFPHLPMDNERTIEIIKEYSKTNLYNE